MRAVVLAAVLVLGCRGSDKLDKALDEQRRLKDRMCACPDKACADAVDADYTAWRTRTREAAGTDRPSESQDYKGRVIRDELDACRRTKRAGSATRAE